MILDQLPSAVAGEVVKNTATKIAFRQVDSEDRQIIGSSMLFEPFEDEQIARLLPGEAYFFTVGYKAPRLLKTVNVEESWPLPPPPSCEELLPRLMQEEWFLETARARVAEELALLQAKIAKLEDQCRQMLDQAARLVESYPAILDGPSGAGREQRLGDLARRVERLSQTLRLITDTFHRDVYRPLLGQEPLPAVVGTDLVDQRRRLIDRFDQVSRPGVRACLEVLGKLIRRCRMASPPYIRSTANGAQT